MQLDKALSDLKNLQQNTGSASAENEKLKAELLTLKSKLANSETELEILKQQILDKLDSVLKAEKAKMFAEDELAKMAQNMKEMKESEEIMAQ